MNASEFHRTPVGAKVIASIGNSEHVTKVLQRGGPGHARKFLLEFHLADGSDRKLWCLANRCRRTDDDFIMGRGGGKARGLTATVGFGVVSFDEWDRIGD
jgi:hypothetical protein